MMTNDELLPGQEIRSPNGQTRLVFQGDGNLVVYGLGRAIWSTGTQSTDPSKRPERLVLQGDGNLVLRGNGKAWWSSGTNGTSARRLLVKDDGRLVLDGGGQVHWKTSAVCDTLKSGKDLIPGQALYNGKGRKLLLQTDGNLVLSQSGDVKWSTGTNTSNPDTRPNRLVLQGDGNLVLYAPGGDAKWSSGTNASNPDNRPNRLVLQGDGKLVLYAPGGDAKWAKPSGGGGSSSGSLLAEYGKYPHKDAPKQDCLACWGNPIGSEFGYDKRNCTDYVAWWLRDRHGVADSLTRGNGNGKQWNAKPGVRIVSNPKPGDVYVTGDDQYGHVGVVLEVSGSTMHTANWDGYTGAPFDSDVSASSVLRILRFDGFTP